MKTFSHMESGMAKRGAALILFSVLTGANASEDHPKSGIAYNVKESSALHYSCELDGSDLYCKMNQTSVRRKYSDSEREKKRADLNSVMLTEEREGKTQERCRTMEEMNRNIDELLKPQNKLTPLQARSYQLGGTGREQFKSYYSEWSQYCKRQNTTTRANLINKFLDVDFNTCTISSNSWNEVFMRAPGPLGGNFNEAPIWIRKSQGPEGACGVIQANRWEADTKAYDYPKFKFWNYAAKKLISNPSGKGLFGFECKNLDEAEYVYDWKKQPIPFSCQYLEFSPF
jgi:hypothetical protein